jgi:RNA ligase (TIGR02306 family)
MKRKLASIQRILDVSPIEEADTIETVQVLGWQVVARKDDFKPDDLCVYVEIDSVLPDRPEFDFLRKAKFRVKTIRLRGQISQGICFPLSILPNGEYSVGDDVTDIIGVEKWEPSVPIQLRGIMKRFRPHWIRKTDEPRLQSFPEVLEEIRGLSLYITRKDDGTSFTAYLKDGEFGVCSRKVDLKENDDNTYWKMARKLNLEEKLSSLPFNAAIQGELVGPQIQGNRLGLKEHELRIFNVWNIDEQKFLDFEPFIETVLLKLRLDPVSIIEYGYIHEKSHDVKTFLEMARGTYPNGQPREGIVIRPMVEQYSKALEGRLSFKVINNDFLLKYGE